MEIEYLQVLRDNPKKGPFENKPLSLDKICALEFVYNSGNEFPKALREMLFLAGKYCIVLDFGLNHSQEELQEDTRKWMQEFDRSISRPFYVIDVYNALDQCLFVYLDEVGVQDPVIYEAYYDNALLEPSWIRCLDSTISDLITLRLNCIKMGENPF
jgi:hypothetical protein